ncbi:hypothetical protein [Bacteroides sp.]|uniref:hypothetical protein n=1 Tax=Bacteroides sp. TaxID=29523 RepID=UPI00262A7AD4|nr:hypothetical protein [Bacteroides sp.]MDD3040530.1 hypothetical protein [Bacteroides sp.]
MSLDEEFNRLYLDSPVEVQKKFDKLQGDKVKARELADAFGSIAVEDITGLAVSVEILEMAAEFLLQDCKQIRQAAVEIAEEERAADELRTGSTLL